MFAQRSRIRLLVYELRQDDPKRCTSAKLVRLHLAQPIFRAASIPKKAVVLNPVASEILASSDSHFMKGGGVVAIDCSWEKYEEVFARKFRGINRRLPLLLAGNPTNYGQLGKLSSAEALAAALHIGGFEAQARELMAVFKWGQTFIALNKNPLEEYGLARSREEMIAVEKAYFAG